jgi:hypothetical protein
MDGRLPGRRRMGVSTRFLKLIHISLPGLLLLVPWLNAHTSGPTPNAWSWLVSAMCAILLWLLRRRLGGQLVAATWVLAAALSGLMGLLQYFGWAQALHPWLSQTGPGEAFANLRQRNQFATLTSIGLIALIALIALLARQDPARKLPLWWAVPAIALLALGNAASGSRTGLLQWVVIVLLSAWWFLPQRPRLLALAAQALAFYGAAMLGLPWLLERVTGMHSEGLVGRLVTSPGCASRKVLWSNVLDLIGQKPGLGWGWGELDYAHFITLYQGERFCEILDNAHNLPLHLAVELGIPLALAVCGVAVFLVWRAKPWRETDPMRQMAWGVLAVIGVHSLLEYPLWYGPFQIAAGLCVALLWTLPQARGGVLAAIPGQEKFRPLRAVVGYLQLLGPIVAAGLLGAAAMSYHQVSQIYLPPAERIAAYRDDTLNKIRNNWLFHPQARFAELSMTGLVPANAADVHAMAMEMLHYSPEPRVVEKLIESAVMLDRDEEALHYLMRYRAAFPADHARWARENALTDEAP